MLPVAHRAAERVTWIASKWTSTPSPLSDLSSLIRTVSVAFEPPQRLRNLEIAIVSHGVVSVLAEVVSGGFRLGSGCLRHARTEGSTDE